MRRKPARTSPAIQLFLTSSLSTTSTSSPTRGRPLPWSSRVYKSACSRSCFSRAAPDGWVRLHSRGIPTRGECTDRESKGNQGRGSPTRGRGRGVARERERGPAGQEGECNVSTPARIPTVAPLKGRTSIQDPMQGSKGEGKPAVSRWKRIPLCERNSTSTPPPAPPPKGSQRRTQDGWDKRFYEKPKDGHARIAPGPACAGPQLELGPAEAGKEEICGAARKSWKLRRTLAQTPWVWAPCPPLTSHSCGRNTTAR